MNIEQLNWYARPQGTKYFKRQWVEETEIYPTNFIAARAWDKASSVPSEVYRYPDYTATVKMLKSPEGYYYIVGDHHPLVIDKIDKDKNIYGRFRARAGERDAIIEMQAQQDGKECTIVFPVDPGQAGNTEFNLSSKKLVMKGFTVKRDPMPTQKSKLTRFTPFCAAAEAGLIKVIPSTFTEESLKHLYKELESFDGERSTAIKKLDLGDAAASCFNYLARENHIPDFNYDSFPSTSTMREHLV